MPPSPQPPRFLLGKKEYALAHPSSPLTRQVPSTLRRAPIAWQASSITGTPRLAAMASTRSMYAIWPKRCTGMIARVRGVMARSSAAGSMLNVSGSMSTNTGVPPAL